MSTAVPPTAGKVNYGGNSKVAQENAAAVEAKEERVPREKIEGVTVVETKPTLGSRFAKAFGGENLKTVGKSVILDVLLPGARDIAFDMIKEGAHRALYPGTTSRGTIGQTIAGSVIRGVNYSSISSGSKPVIGSQSAVGVTQLTAQEKAQFDFSRLVFPQEAMALEVLEKLHDAIQEFNVVPVADFYDFIGQTGNGFTDLKYGWNPQTFQGAHVRRVRGGFILNLPAPKEIG